MEFEHNYTEQVDSAQADWLDCLSREDVLEGQIPLNDILHNSLYYMASGTDRRPIEECNLRRANLGIRSFIYADYDLGKEDWKEELKLYGYHLLAVREFSPNEIILPEEHLWLPPEMKFGKKHRFILEQMKDYGFWAVFERNEDKDSQHGPKRISLLFLSREGVVTYSSLYLRNKISPTIVALIRPNGGNWECFRGYNSPLETVAERGISMPAYYLGDGIAPCEWRGYSLVDNNFYRYSKQ